ncbi:MAG: orotidine-5'-phosphate decarboxylase [Actinomycetia bacterium]|nr:orotidine-5'-phosphate decarboxylase [Actinomycetes bacterium]
MKTNSNSRIIVALDLPTGKAALDLAATLVPEFNFFKVGSSLFCAEGFPIIQSLQRMGASIFLDLKLHDIPEQVRKTASIIGAFGVDMISVHCLGGDAMLRAAKEGVTEGAKRANAKPPRVVGVTVLTSLDESDLLALGVKEGVESEVSTLAGLAQAAGLDGVVASPREIELIKRQAGNDFIIVTPGIRPGSADTADQKRVLSPSQAIDAGATYLVVGRPITAAANPRSAALKIAREAGV